MDLCLIKILVIVLTRTYATNVIDWVT